MNINFAPIDEAFIKTKIAEGYYSNATELVRDAVRKLREKEANIDNKLRAALYEGENSINNGDFTIFKSGFLEDIEKQARDDFKNNVKPNPLVCP